MSYTKEQLLNRLNCTFFLFYIFQGTNKYIVLLQQENLIFVEILEQSFSKIYHQMGKLLYIFLKFI